MENVKSDLNFQTFRMEDELPLLETYLRGDKREELEAVLARLPASSPTAQEIGLAFLEGIQFAQRIRPNA